MGYKKRTEWSTGLKEGSRWVSVGTSSHRFIDHDFSGEFYFVVVIRQYVEAWENSERKWRIISLSLCHVSSPSLAILIHYIRSIHQHLWSFPLNCCSHCPFLAVPSCHFPSPDPHHLLPKLHSLSGPPPWLQPLLGVIQSAYCCQILPPKNLCQRIYIWLKFELLCIFIITERNYKKKKFRERKYPFIP